MIVRVWVGATWKRLRYLVGASQRCCNWFSHWVLNERDGVRNSSSNSCLMTSLVFRCRLGGRCSPAIESIQSASSRALLLSLSFSSASDRTSIVVGKASGLQVIVQVPISDVVCQVMNTWTEFRQSGRTHLRHRGALRDIDARYPQNHLDLHLLPSVRFENYTIRFYTNAERRAIQKAPKTSLLLIMLLRVTQFMRRQVRTEFAIFVPLERSPHITHVRHGLHLVSKRIVDRPYSP
jgi:hypothetical protein